MQGTLPQTFVHAGPGNDEILVGNLNRSLDDILGTLTIDAESGRNNYLRVDDSGDPRRRHRDDHIELDHGFSPAAIFYGATGGTYGSDLRSDRAETFSRGIDILGGHRQRRHHDRQHARHAGAIEVTTVYAGAGNDHVLVADQGPQLSRGARSDRQRSARRDRRPHRATASRCTATTATTRCSAALTATS